MLTPENSGASPLACEIVNQTFLSLDGYAALRKQLDGSTYDSLAFAASQARMIDGIMNQAKECSLCRKYGSGACVALDACLPCVNREKKDE